jgi:hypothetical protein
MVRSGTSSERLHDLRAKATGIIGGIELRRAHAPYDPYALQFQEMP